jgi:hypothetical protein
MGERFFATVHDRTVGGNVVVRGVHACWFGLIRSTVAGTVKVVGNPFGDPDADEIVTNDRRQPVVLQQRPGSAAGRLDGLAEHGRRPEARRLQEPLGGG